MGEMKGKDQDSKNKGGKIKGLKPESDSVFKMCESGELVVRLERLVREALNSCTNGTSGSELSDADAGSDDGEKEGLLRSLLSAIVNNNSTFYDQANANEFNSTGTPTGRDSITDKLATLNKLEMIKVVVLIVVILIILITTCRMVFQLSMRFRPEKNIAD